MNEENFILVSLEDSKLKEISEILGSKTCKKIIGYLSQNKEASQKDLSIELKIPMNTLDYNIKKLLSSGFIQKRKNFFWSKKGKKIIMYEISNKFIVISSKKSTGEKIKSIIPAFILTLAGTFSIWVYEQINFSGSNSTYNSIVEEATISSVYRAVPSSGIYPSLLSSQSFPLWSLFLAGALLAISIISIINWKKL